MVGSKKVSHKHLRIDVQPGKQVPIWYTNWVGSELRTQCWYPKNSMSFNKKQPLGVIKGDFEEAKTRKGVSSELPGGLFGTAMQEGRNCLNGCKMVPGW